MKPAAIACALACLPAAAQAGEVACWYEQGVIVAPASIAGLAGDYILDTGAPATQVHETRAEGAGFVDPAQRGQVRIAGLTLPDRPFTVTDLDARTHAFPTPIAGVIGADLLAAYVVDVSFSPCRVAIHPLGEAPRFGAGTSLALGRNATARASVADGPRTLTGEFVIATGSDTAVRIDERLASIPGAEKPEAFLPYGEGRAELRAASFAGALFENLEAGLTPAAETAGVIGAPLLSRWRLRFDFPRGRLLLAPAGG